MKKGLYLVLTLSTFLLTSCVSAVLVGAAVGAGGAIVNDKRSITTMTEDSRIMHELSMAIIKNSEFRTSHIVLSAFENMLFLGGQVPEARLKRLAETLALRHPDVKRVYNEITVGPNTTFTQQSTDTWITTKVKTMMLARSGLKSGSIKVITEQGVVYLMGEVSHDQSNLAVDVARRVNGVKKVVKLFKYTD